MNPDDIAYAQFMANNGGSPSDRSQYAAWSAAQAKGAGGTPKSAADAQLETQRVMLQMQQEKKTTMNAQGLNADGSPIAPDYKSPLGADGNMDSRYTVSPWNNVSANTGALNQMRGEAMRGAGTNSTWANLALQKQQLGQDQAMDNAAAGSNNSMLAAASQLAQSGGLDGGQRERMMGQANQNGFIQRQQVGRQGMMDRNAIQSQDETQRQTGLRDLQTADNQQADIQFKNQQQAANNQQFNATNMFKSNDAQNTFNQDKWKKQMEVFSAGKTADAQQRASGGGGKK